MNYIFGECHGYFTTTKGTLKSPSYPDNYPKNMDCVYTISQPNGTIIKLIFHNMDIQMTHSCRYDYLEIRDGPSDDSSIMDKLCGNQIPAPILSNQNHVWMK